MCWKGYRESSHWLGVMLCVHSVKKSGPDTWKRTQLPLLYPIHTAEMCEGPSGTIAELLEYWNIMITLARPAQVAEPQSHEQINSASGKQFSFGQYITWPLETVIRVLIKCDVRTFPLVYH